MSILIYYATYSWGDLATGETLQDERTNGGMFIGADGIQFSQKMMPVSNRMDLKAFLFVQELNILECRILFHSASNLRHFFCLEKFHVLFSNIFLSF